MNEEIRAQMSNNYYKMKNLKFSYATILFTNIAMLFVMMIFTFLSGFMPLLIGADIMIIAGFYCGHQLFEKRRLLWGIMIINIALFIAYLIVQPFSELFVRVVLGCHFLMAGEMYLFLVLGRQKEDLSCELGYPYFTELAFYRQEFKGYEQQNDITAGTEDMDTVNSEKEYVLNNAVHKRDGDPEMDYVSEADISGSMESKVIDQDNEYNDYYKKMIEKANEEEHEEEIDLTLLKTNNGRMKAFKMEQRILFFIDAVMMLIALTKAVDGLSAAIFGNPLYIFMIFNVFAVGSASLITVTCLDNEQAGTIALYAYLALWVFFLLISKYSFPFSYPVCALQMFYVKKLSADDKFLRSQKGYPYFSEAMFRHQSHSSKYTSQYDIRLQSVKKEMDKI